MHCSLWTRVSESFWEALQLVIVMYETGPASAPSVRTETLMLFFRRLSKDGEDSNLDRPFLLDKQAYLLNLVWSCLFHHTVCLLGWIPQFKVLPWTFTLLLILSNSQARPAYPINPAQLRNQANKAISMAGSKGRSFLFQQTRWDHQGAMAIQNPNHTNTPVLNAHISHLPNCQGHTPWVWSDSEKGVAATYPAA